MVGESRLIVWLVRLTRRPILPRSVPPFSMAKQTALAADRRYPTDIALPTGGSQASGTGSGGGDR